MEIPASLLMSSGMHAYVAVSGSLSASDCFVYSLNGEEEQAIRKRFGVNKQAMVTNGMWVTAYALAVVNALGELGYKVVSTTGESSITWTMQREL